MEIKHLYGEMEAHRWCCINLRVKIVAKKLGITISTDSVKYLIWENVRFEVSGNSDRIEIFRRYLCRVWTHERIIGWK